MNDRASGAIMKSSSPGQNPDQSDFLPLQHQQPSYTFGHSMGPAYAAVSQQQLSLMQESGVAMPTNAGNGSTSMLMPWPQTVEGQHYMLATASWNQAWATPGIQHQQHPVTSVAYHMGSVDGGGLNTGLGGGLTIETGNLEPEIPSGSLTYDDQIGVPNVYGAVGPGMLMLSPGAQLENDTSAVPMAHMHKDQVIRSGKYVGNTQQTSYVAGSDMAGAAHLSQLSQTAVSGLSARGNVLGGSFGNWTGGSSYISNGGDFNRKFDIGEFQVNGARKFADTKRQKPANKYQCEVCGKSFNQSGNLNRHKVVHTRERPFSCDVCGKGFSQKSHVRTHQTVHSGVKAFQCHICQKRFSQLGHLNGHLDRHRRNTETMTQSDGYVEDKVEQTKSEGLNTEQTSEASPNSEQ